MRLALLTGLTLIILASSIFGVVDYQNHIKQVNAASTATVEAANATATASVIAAVEAANATATASVIAANPYPSYLTGNGTLALYDSLSQSGYWYNSSYTSFGGACQFTNGAYHISQTKPQRLFDCVAGPSFTNFAFEVHMTIIQGDCGGIVFRRDSTNANLYVFQVCQNGSYRLLHFVNHKVDKTLTSNSSSTIHTGLNQSNVIAVVANGNTLDLYVNQQKIDNVSDSTYSHGQVGIFAHDYSNPTEVVYSNARVWTL